MMRAALYDAAEGRVPMDSELVFKAHDPGFKTHYMLQLITYYCLLDSYLGANPRNGLKFIGVLRANNLTLSN